MTMVDSKILHADSKVAADSYLATARRAIDDEFGPGFAAANPQLVGAFMQAAATEYAGSLQAAVLEESMRELGDRLADAIDNIAGNMSSE